jgi:hypothetical protein
VKERPVGERLRRHLAEPVVKGGEAAGERRGDRNLCRRVPGHDLRVLVVPRLAAHLGGERADVVGDEAVHRRTLARVWRRVVGHDHLPGQEAPVGRRVDTPEQLGVDVRVLLARVRARRVHGRRDAVLHDTAAVTAVSRPVRDRVAEVLPGDALERRHLARLVQPAEQVVEGSVLEHDHDYVIESVSAVRTGHGSSFHQRLKRGLGRRIGTADH